MGAETQQVVHELAAESLRIAPGRISDSLAVGDVPEWDSIAHLSLITAVETRFDIRFAMTEVLALKTIGDLIRLVETRISQRAGA